MLSYPVQQIFHLLSHTDVNADTNDANRTIVQNIDRAITKQVAIKISDNEVLSIEDADVYYCCRDLWKTTNERLNSQYQGIDTDTTANIRVLIPIQQPISGY